MTETIEDIWNELSTQGTYPTHRRVSAEHPMDLYGEVAADGRIGLLVIASKEPPIAPRYRSVDIEIRRRTDGRWALRLILSRPDLRVLFRYLCEDIIQAGIAFEPKSESCKFVLERLARWRKMLNIGSDELLSETDVRGLIGELLFLKGEIPKVGVLAAVTAWNGPYDSPRDFDFADASFEVKTIRPGAVSVRIGSLDQLDSAGEGLTLVVYQLSNADSNSTGDLSLPQLVNELRSMIETDVGIIEEFELKLLVAGYQDRDEYRNMIYRLDDQRYYSVAEGFPRLARSRLPHAIAEAKYDLFLADCEPFRTTPE